MTEIREYYLTQMHKVREHYEQQRNLILEFSINENLEPQTTCRTAKNGDILVKMENGNISANILPEEDVYKYNDAMKSEIQKLTSLRNLHEMFLDGDKCDFSVPVISKDEIRKNDHENGKLKTPPDIEDEEDENTNMLANCRQVSGIVFDWAYFFITTHRLITYRCKLVLIFRSREAGILVRTIFPPKGVHRWKKFPLQNKVRFLSLAFLVFLIYRIHGIAKSIENLISMPKN